MNPLYRDAALTRNAAGQLAMDGVELGPLADAVGTPAFVYALGVIRHRYSALQHAFQSMPHRILFAVKANASLAVLRTLADCGAGADVVSMGEAARCLHAGFAPSDIVFTGVGKTRDELKAAVGANLGLLHVESVAEIAMLDDVARQVGRPVRIGLRVNPDVATDTHPYISTGEAGLKFGIPWDQVPQAAAAVRQSGFLRVEALAVHLGSQLLSVAPYQAAADRLVELYHRTRELGLDAITTLDIGGGLGVRYSTEEPPSPADLAGAVLPILADTGCSVTLAPGRYLSAAAGLLLTRVLYRKRSGARDFVVTDAGMTELARPSRYGAWHEIVTVGRIEGESVVCDVVGPVCETGDFLARDRLLPPVQPGDLLAVLGAGAYGAVMGSTYNGRSRPPEVVVDAGSWGLARHREPTDDLWRGEVLAPVMHSTLAAAHPPAASPVT